MYGIPVLQEQKPVTWGLPVQSSLYQTLNIKQAHLRQKMSLFYIKSLAVTYSIRIILILTPSGPSFGCSNMFHTYLSHCMWSSLLQKLQIIKKATLYRGWPFLLFKSLAVTYFHMGTPTLSSALSRFTSEFGMGSGGTNSLWPPGITGG